MTSVNTAFDIDLQQDDNLINLFDEQVNSPDSIISNSSCEDDDILSVAAKMPISDNSWGTELAFNYGAQNNFNLFAAQQPAAVPQIAPKQPIAKPVQKQPVKKAIAKPDNTAMQHMDPNMWQNSLFANSFAPQMQNSAEVSQMFESFLKELSPKVATPHQPFMTSPMPPNTFPFVNMNINAFNVMNPVTGFPQAMPAAIPVAPSPVPSSNASSQPVKKEETSEARKKRAAKRRREPNSASSSASSSATSSPTPGEAPSSPSTGSDSKPETALPKDEKEVKRQKRLIKNRESAQASRERKKVYVQNLEQKISDLTTSQSSLCNKLMTLEEENQKLRDRLKRLEQGEDVSKLPPVEAEEPSAKRRRVTQTPKIALPPLNKSQPVAINPFTMGFWRNMMMGVPANGAQVAMPAGSTPVVPVGWMPQAPSRGVVLFIMILCVALLVVPNQQSKAEVKSEVGAPESAENIQTKVSIGRQILQANNVSKAPTNKPEGAATQTRIQLPSSTNAYVDSIKQRFEEFAAIKFDDSDDLSTEIKIKQEPMDDDVIAVPSQDEQIDFKVHMDKGNLLISLPTALTGETSNPKDDMQSKVVSISKKLLKDICQYLE